MKPSLFLTEKGFGFSQITIKKLSGDQTVKRERALQRVLQEIN